MIKQLALTLTILATAYAQPGQGPGMRESGPPAKEFEVASIKPIDGGDPMSQQVSIAMQPGGRLTATGVNASFLIQQAYNVRDFQITGGPSWVRDDRYQINAKADGVVNGREAMRPLYEKLLADRFKLQVTRETKEMPIYKLVVNKGGVKMKENTEPNAPGGGQVRVGRGQLAGNRMDTGMLARQLSVQLGRLVVDGTGLTGAYDFTLNFTPEGVVPPDGASPSADGAAPSIFVALQDLGLKLESTKGPVETVVISRIEKPTEN